MIDTFHKHIRISLGNESLQIALDANAERRIAARNQALDSLSEDWQILSQRAHKIRLDTISNLDDYLEQFINQAAANGMIVHQAADAAQAVQIVLKIAEQKGARLIAKSKTMVSEEIGLNHALEAEGIQVVETDLGEYIVQLRGERPAHIITPAVHLRKQDVGKTFHEKLGIPYTEDVQTMTAAARKRLRQTFLEADIGVSGVNFGVADSGTICIVTNEGNGRMVTTLPPVHIALMGIERLVPSMEDLALMLDLLPRSATGQKITVYTSLINAPRGQDEPDGPLERHLILVDNGRTAMRNSPLAEALLCIRCGACLNVCPVYGELGGHAYVNVQGESSIYPGPIGSIVSPGLFGQAEFGHLARASSLCGACLEACPVEIDLPKLLLRVRAGGMSPGSQIVDQKIPKHVNWGLRLYTWFALDSKRFTTLLKLAGFFSQLISPRSTWLHLPAFTGWGYSKDLPRPDRRPFRERWEDLQLADIHPVETKESEYPGQTKSEKNDTTKSVERDTLVQRFQSELTALDGNFTSCKADDLSQLVFDELKKFEVSSILSWESKQIPNGLIDALLDRGITTSEDFDPQVKVGISGALAAIAETGTLVLPSGSGRPQFVSLTPEIHLVVLRASAICQNLAQIMELREVKEASAIDLISGPSRTADIEMTLTIGVHGPCQVHVYCLEDE
ncbi:MAG: LutB/LldF family L-lactate oxidation iron-sulfur protein [Anaerolineales bacterium]